MKTLNNFLTEKLKLNKQSKIDEYSYHPKDKDELRSLLKQLLEKRGNNADLNDIDTSDITDMSWLFAKLDPHNIDISEWNVSNVENMFYMFYACKNFNSDLSKWNVSKVKYMHCMFWGCNKFTSDLSKWNVSKVEDMFRIFASCTSLKNKPSWYKE